MAVRYELGLVTLHEVTTGRSVPLRGVQHPVTALCWSGDGTSVWAGDLLGLVLRWDLAPTWSVRPDSDISGPLVAWSVDSGTVVVHVAGDEVEALAEVARTGGGSRQPDRRARPSVERQPPGHRSSDRHLVDLGRQR